MLSLTSIFAIFAVTLYAIGLLRTITAALEAPIGYEDDAGFHYGIAIPAVAECTVDAGNAG
jgi:hypothetical protein